MQPVCHGRQGCRAGGGGLCADHGGRKWCDRAAAMPTFITCRTAVEPSKACCSSGDLAAMVPACSSSMFIVLRLCDSVHVGMALPSYEQLKGAGTMVCWLASDTGNCKRTGAPGSMLLAFRGSLKLNFTQNCLDAWKGIPERVQAELKYFSLEMSAWQPCRSLHIVWRGWRGPLVIRTRAPHGVPATQLKASARRNLHRIYVSKSLIAETRLGRCTACTTNARQPCIATSCSKRP